MTLPTKHTPKSRRGFQISTKECYKKGLPHCSRDCLAKHNQNPENHLKRNGTELVQHELVRWWPSGGRYVTREERSLRACSTRLGDPGNQIRTMEGETAFRGDALY